MARELPESLPSPLSRRDLVVAAGSALAAGLLARQPARASGQVSIIDPDGLRSKILELFASLPGAKAMKISIPGESGAPGWSVAQDSARRLVVASSFKTFVLAESLRQAEALVNPSLPTPILDQLSAVLFATKLPLDQAVWVPGSPVFDPPSLSGLASERRSLEAMSSHSDNTGTDMAIKNVGIDRVRNFISGIGL